MSYFIITEVGKRLRRINIFKLLSFFFSFNIPKVTRWSLSFNPLYLNTAYFVKL